MSSGVNNLARAILMANRRMSGGDQVAVGTVMNSSDNSPSVRFPGYETPIDVVLSDIFTLYPLAVGDVVLAVRADDLWFVVARINGEDPEYNIGLENIDESVIVAGPPFASSDVVVDVLVQGYRSRDAQSFSPGVSAYTWNFDSEFAVAPIVTTGLEVNPSYVQNLFVGVSALDNESATLFVKNTSSESITGRVVATATGRT